jgi:methionyl-tRNA formyltransferase
MRVAIVTSMRVGAAGLALERLSTSGTVTPAAVIFNDQSGLARRRLLQRRLLKSLRIGPLGAANGIRMRGWYRHTEGADIFETARRLNVPVYNIPRFSDPAAMDTYRSLNVDLGISLGNGFIPEAFFSIPRLGMINYHGELLPEYPGALSVIWPIYFERLMTGFSVHRVSAKIDRGDVLIRREFPIQFRSTLRDTVEATGRTIYPHLPDAICEACENFAALVEAKLPSNYAPSFTTPTFSQYMRMARNNQKLYRRRLDSTLQDQSASSESVLGEKSV